MRALRNLSFAVIAAASLGTAGCDGEATQLDNGPQSYDLVNYFGLQTGRCFEYTTHDTKQAVPDLGVVVSKTDVKAGVLTYVVDYLGPNGIVMEDWFSVDGNNLLLRRRSFPSGKTWLYPTPVLYARAPAKDGDHFETTTLTELWDSLGNKVEDPFIEHTLSVDVFAAPAVSVPARDAALDALKMSYSETPPRCGYVKPGEQPCATPRPETRTFIPGTGDVAAADGWLIIENNFSTTDNQPNTFYKLQAVRDLGTDYQSIISGCGRGQ